MKLSITTMAFSLSIFTAMTLGSTASLASALQDPVLTNSTTADLPMVARRGADDPPGDDRGGKRRRRGGGHDDGTGHTELKSNDMMI
ncbi:MAG: hypothetical protein KDK89_04905, partial [Alphaproteobacteria bacterium]|nr:hypothetical protein [Alphaproteobacteria bacterium]